MMFSKVKVHYSFYLLFLSCLLMDNFLDYLCIFCVFILHELGHLFFIILKKGKIFSIKISLFGGIISTNVQNSFLVDFGRHFSKFNNILCY